MAQQRRESTERSEPALICSWCLGHPRLQIGTEQAVCRYCHGTGHTPKLCPICGGHGGYRKQRRWRSCHPCRGTGRQP